MINVCCEQGVDEGIDIADCASGNIAPECTGASKNSVTNKARISGFKYLLAHFLLLNLLIQLYVVASRHFYKNLQTMNKKIFRIWNKYYCSLT